MSCTDVEQSPTRIIYGAFMHGHFTHAAVLTVKRDNHRIKFRIIDMKPRGALHIECTVAASTLPHVFPVNLTTHVAVHDSGLAISQHQRFTRVKFKGARKTGACEVYELMVVKVGH